MNEESVAAFIASVRSHPQADMYAALWGGVNAFADLPPLTVANIAQTPLSRRTYTDAPAMAKIVRRGAYEFLSQWSFTDIATEPYGVPSVRPMSYFTDSSDAIEKAMWCYEHDMVPLIGERDPAVARYTAEVCDIDSLMTDAASLAQLRPYLMERREPLASISVVGTDFSDQTLFTCGAFARAVRFVLALPETGAFAVSTPDAYPTFTVLDDCIVEGNGELTLTKARLLAMPIIRYRTGLSGIVSQDGRVLVLS